MTLIIMKVREVLYLARYILFFYGFLCVRARQHLPAPILIDEPPGILLVKQYLPVTEKILNYYQ